MSESKHTPGPWSVPHFAKPDSGCQCDYVLTDTMMGAVCSVYVSGDGDDWKGDGDNPKFDEAVANAHLIASAPDLLEALKIARTNLRYLQHGEPDADGEDLHASAVEAWNSDLAKIDAAIAKATGGRDE